MQRKAIVLAAGKGTRLQSESMDLPKALRMLCGKPLIRYVLDNLNFQAPDDITIVVGFRKEMVIEALGQAYRYVEQQEQNGTARATLCAEPELQGYAGPVIVCYCDMPFLARDTYLRLFERHMAAGAGNTLLSGRFHPIPPYGRLIRDPQGRLIDIIEESACTPGQKRIDEVNVGLQVIDGARMWGWLRQIDNENPRREYYLTSLARVLAREGVPQEVVEIANQTETLGVNTLEDLRAAEALLGRG